MPEIERFAGLSRRPIFVPSAGHFRQGMLASGPLYLDELPGKPAGADLREALRAFYQGSERVGAVVGSTGAKLEPEALNTPTGSSSTSGPMKSAATPCWLPASTISVK